MTNVHCHSIIWILFAHFVGDFILQTDEMAKNKSTSWKWLAEHVKVYTIALFVITSPLIMQSSLRALCFFCLVNGAAHFYVDAITSRINSKLYKAQMIHEFFIGVGADQFIHAATLILTYTWILK